MAKIDDMAQEFLAQKRIGVVGISRTGQSAANGIFDKLKQNGYQVFPVTPNMESYKDTPCYPDVPSIPGGVDGVVIVTKPEVTEQVVQDCAQAGVPRVWIHESLNFFPSSVSDTAVQFCHDHNITVIDGGCPMMFCQPVDFGHKCIRWYMKRKGQLPV